MAKRAEARGRTMSDIRLQILRGHLDDGRGGESSALGEGVLTFHFFPVVCLRSWDALEPLRKRLTFLKFVLTFG